MGLLKDIAKDWNDLNTDKERWEYLLQHPGEFCVFLDNDMTFVEFNRQLTPNDYDDEIELNSFDNYIGNSHGVFVLLTVLGISCDYV